MTPFEIADRLTESYADLAPILATTSGVAGRDHLWDDLSPDGEAAKADLRATAISELSAQLDHDDPVQARAAKILVSYLETLNERYRSGHWKQDINHIYSPFQRARDTFDVAPKGDAAAWADVATRLATFGDLLDGYRASLQVGLDEGETAARRQVASLVEQVRSVAGEDSRFAEFPALAESSGGDRDAVAEAVRRARVAASEFADWLEASYLPAARSGDAIGEDRYLEGARYFLGLDLDPHETYEWGWSEVHRLLGEMKATAAEIDPGKSIEEVITLLDTDPQRSAPDHQSFAEFVKTIQARAVEQLEGTDFDVPDEIREVTVNIAPPGGSLGAWYHGPSEDFSRPGSIWYAPGERTRIPYWQEVSTAYHEGFPGHHLQVGFALLQREKLSRFHRQFIWYSGAGEGWALYAERLMDELGYFENPEYRFGLLSSQLFRSARVVVDIGTQLEKKIPSDAPLHAGEVWDYDIAVDYMEKIGLNARDVSESEVKRYLGWPAQAISYKVGEREILDIREQAVAKAGGNLDRKDFHRRLLEAGAIRLDHLREAMA
ncbi:MAG TPA: DUF885 domain-containing protein, partial [Acidimicrobiia bacterium]|nr:DUF885 domain-containing protein [Acidimicrobiia bacterium]